MRYKLLGSSGLRVAELCLGTMTFGEDWGWGASAETSRAIFDLYAEAGGNFIDTSTNYTEGSSEKILGDCLKANRDYFVIATKYTLTTVGQTDPNQGGNNRKNMRQTVERSLRRLQTDTLDILYLHVWDYTTSTEEILRGLDDLVSSGKVQYIAISDTPAWIVAECNTLATLRGWSRFIGLQIPYSLLNRTAERAELLMAKHWDMGVLPWGILGGGLLTGKYRADNHEPKRQGDRVLDERTQQIVDEVGKVADELGRTPSQIAINWVRQQQARAQMIPILGARTLDQLRDNLACLDFEIENDQMTRLNNVSQIDYGFPRSFVEGSGIREYIFGQTYDRIDNHRGYPAK
ncbi:MAG: aldo/keto reductase [Anaerolineae bacterium]|jgi:aryl-alcohol dehydrogenase-like predicted oxidoreductase|nr:aldo/keto reductase [Anaerolineae bacterium]